MAVRGFITAIKAVLLRIAVTPIGCYGAVRKIFEPLPILVAAAIGAVAIWYALRDEIDTSKALAIGAVTGAVIQMSVRLFGVS